MILTINILRWMKERERENDMTICCSFQMYYIVYVNLNRIKMRTGKKKKKKKTVQSADPDQTAPK